MRKIIVVFRIIIFVFSLMSIYSAQGQSTEYGLGLGGSVYWGDMNSESLTNSIEHAHPGISIFGRINYSSRLSVNASLTFAKLSGDDSKSTDELRKQRNLSFFTPLSEFALAAEFNIFKFDPLKPKIQFTPYFYLGAAIFHFNPKTTYNGETVVLQPLGTEGQGIPGDPKNKYSRIALALPIGGGLKLSLGNGFVFEGKLIARFTTTDYIDDLSTDYADYNFLLRYNGEMAAYLSDRRDEYFGLGEGSFNDVSSTRGGEEVKDYYLTAMISLSKVLKGNVLNSRRSGACPSAF